MREGSERFCRTHILRFRTNQAVEIHEIAHLIDDWCSSESPASRGDDGGELCEGLAVVVASLVRLVEDETVPGLLVCCCRAYKDALVVGEVDGRVVFRNMNDMPVRANLLVDADVCLGRDVSPLLQHSKRADDERPGHRVVQDKADDADSLAQTHLISQDAAIDVGWFIIAFALVGLVLAHHHPPNRRLLVTHIRQPVDRAEGCHSFG